MSPSEPTTVRTMRRLLQFALVSVDWRVEITLLTPTWRGEGRRAWRPPSRTRVFHPPSASSSIASAGRPHLPFPGERTYFRGAKGDDEEKTVSSFAPRKNVLKCVVLTL